MSSPADKLNQVKAIRNGRGIQHIINEAYKILGNPLVMFNTEFHLLAYTDDIGDDPVLNEIVAYGTFSYESQRFFMEEGFGDAVANAKTIAPLISDKLKYDRILGKLFNNNNVHVANLLMVACDRPLEDGLSAVFEAVCESLSKEIIKSEFYQTYGKIYQETYIRRLIEGSIDDRGIYTSHISILYNGLKANLYLAVADISLCDPQHTRLCHFRDLFKKTQPSFKYSIYSNYIVIIVNTDANELNVKKELNKLTKLFDQYNIYAGISYRFENLFELQKHYKEALGALQSGMERADGQRIFLYNTGLQAESP